MADFFEISTIEDVNLSADGYIKERWGVWFFGPLLLFAIFAVLETIYTRSPGTGNALFLAWIIGGAIVAQSKVRKEFMLQFAKTNGLQYVGCGDSAATKGNLFKKGNSTGRSVSHLVEGEKGGRRIKFFLYTYSVGSGKHKQIYNYTVCEIFFNGQAPDIVIESKSDWDFISYAGNQQKEMPVEGFFKEYFGVYVPEDFEIETLEIFTPDVMAYLVEHAKKYNFEFVEDRLYIFRQGFISKRAELQDFLRQRIILLKSWLRASSACMTTCPP